MGRGFRFLTLVLMVAASLSLFADVHTHDEAGIRFEVPDDWNVKWNSPDVCVTSSRGGTLGVNFHILPEEEAQEALRVMEENLEGIITEDVLVLEKEVTINGLAGTWMEFDCKMYGEPGKMLSVILGHEGRVIMVFFFIETSQYPRYKTTIEDIAWSVGPMAGEPLPPEPADGKDIFYGLATTPEIAAMQATLYINMADAELLDLIVHWPAIRDWMEKEEGDLRMSVETVRETMLAEFARQTPQLEREQIETALLNVWGNTEVEYLAPDLAKVTLGVEDSRLAMKVAEFDGLWYLVEFPK